MNSTIQHIKTRSGGFRIAIDGSVNAERTIMFSNSHATTFEMWEPQVGAFADRYQLIRYDTRGHGESVTEKGPYTFRQLADDAFNGMDALELDRVVFCGLSMGGHTALQMALAQPERLEGIVLCDTAAKIHTNEPWEARTARVRQNGPSALKEIAASTPQRWFTESYYKERKTALVDQIFERFALLDPEGYASCCEALGSSDLRDQIKAIDLPTLIIAGRYDPVTTVADAQFMHNEIRHSSLVILEASHLSNIEAAEEFNKALGGFVAGL